MKRRSTSTCLQNDPFALYFHSILICALALPDVLCVLLSCLCGYTHPILDTAPPGKPLPPRFTNLADMKKYVDTNFKLNFCDICMKGRKVGVQCLRGVGNRFKGVALSGRSPRVRRAGWTGGQRRWHQQCRTTGGHPLLCRSPLRFMGAGAIVRRCSCNLPYTQQPAALCQPTPPCSPPAQVFVCEQLLYNKSQLERHNRDGDEEGPLAGSSFKGHPLCRFCRQRFYDSQELWKHMEAAHENCFLCRCGKVLLYRRCGAWACVLHRSVEYGRARGERGLYCRCVVTRLGARHLDTIGPCTASHAGGRTLTSMCTTGTTRSWKVGG